MRRAFTLIELLVIVAIMATMVTVGVVGLNSSQSSTRLFGAGRDVMAMIRRARSQALIQQKPVVLTYSTGTDGDGEVFASVTMKAERIFNSSRKAETVWNLAGDIVSEPEPETEGDGEGEGSLGETIEDILAPVTIPLDVVKGLRIKALDESQELNLPENEMRRSKISIFSTADNVSRTLTPSDAKTPSADGDGADGKEAAVADEPLSVAFAANGTVNPPHRIWIYRDGTSPEKGICIHVDRFGEPKCEDFQ